MKALFITLAVLLVLSVCFMIGGSITYETSSTLHGMGIVGTTLTAMSLLIAIPICAEEREEERRRQFR